MPQFMQLRDKKPGIERRQPHSTPRHDQPQRLLSPSVWLNAGTIGWCKSLSTF